MKFHPNCIYHVYNQGNNQERIFYEEKNYHYFIRKIRTHILPYADILCYCLMPNHFHLLIRVNELASAPGTAVKARKKCEEELDIIVRQGNLNQEIGKMLSSYAQAINRGYNRSGSLFRGKTKAKNGAIEGAISIDGPNKDLFFREENDYARQCFRYIHENPVKARLVRRAVDWPFSSAQEYAKIRDRGLCNQYLAKECGLTRPL